MLIALAPILDRAANTWPSLRCGRFELDSSQDIDNSIKTWRLLEENEIKNRDHRTQPCEFDLL